jgi:hypothetical protein
MMGWKDDKAWTDCAIPQIRAIVGPLLLVPAPLAADVKEATDLIIFHARDMRIAARVRRPGFCDQYPFQFTIRSLRDSSTETELSKLRKGFADWFFYGHLDDTKVIHQWWLIDLHLWRKAVEVHNAGTVRLVCGSQSNADGTHFWWFDLRSFVPSVLIATNCPLPEMKAVHGKRGFVGYDDAGRFVHYCWCGAWGAHGRGVKMRADELCKWHCEEHRPEALAAKYGADLHDHVERDEHGIPDPWGWRYG